MSDELRQAARRIAKSAEAYLRESPGPEDLDYDSEMTQHWTDQSTVARAWLREHPEDDGEPIQEARWIWRVVEAGNVRYRFLKTRQKKPGLMLCRRDAHTDTPIKWVKTRGELRRLLAALGVE